MPQKKNVFAEFFSRLTEFFKNLINKIKEISQQDITIPVLRFVREGNSERKETDTKTESRTESPPDKEKHKEKDEKDKETNEKHNDNKEKTPHLEFAQNICDVVKTEQISHYVYLNETASLNIVYNEKDNTISPFLENDNVIKLIGTFNEQEFNKMVEKIAENIPENIDYEEVTMYELHPDAHDELISFVEQQRESKENTVEIEEDKENIQKEEPLQEKNIQEDFIDEQPFQEEYITENQQDQIQNDFEKQSQIEVDLSDPDFIRQYEQEQLKAGKSIVDIQLELADMLAEQNFKNAVNDIYNLTTNEQKNLSANLHDDNVLHVLSDDKECSFFIANSNTGNIEFIKTCNIDQQNEIFETIKGTLEENGINNNFCIYEMPSDIGSALNEIKISQEEVVEQKNELTTTYPEKEYTLTPEKLKEAIDLQDKSLLPDGFEVQEVPSPFGQYYAVNFEGNFVANYFPEYSIEEAFSVEEGKNINDILKSIEDGNFEPQPDLNEVSNDELKEFADENFTLTYESLESFDNDEEEETCEDIAVSDDDFEL